MIYDDALARNCHFVGRDEFLNRLFPVPSSVVDEVYGILVRNKTYDPTGRKWKDVPKVLNNESSYHKPFVAVAESIRQAYVFRNNAVVSLSCMWIDRHDGAPGSRDRTASLIRPGVLCLLGTNGDEHSQWEALIDDQDKEKQLKAVTSWWLRVNVVVEITPAGSDDLSTHAKQLLGHMRQVLTKQVDRRFVPGLLFSRNSLLMWICDRSGTLGTSEPFDIHYSPKTFIQVIIACSLLPPERLGWDPTMRLCRYPINPQKLELFHSYDPRVTLADYRESLYNTHWVITMPAKDDPAIREEYITVRTISAESIGYLPGRATIVWAVIKVEDMKNSVPPHKIYVLKQCWRPTAGANEGTFFPTSAEMDNNCVCRIHSFEDVLQDDVVVDTQNFVRKNLGAPTVPKNHTCHNATGEQENEAEATAEDCEGCRLDNHNDKTVYPIWRTATRMLFEDYGWPLKYFRDLIELVRILRDIVKAHRWLYFVNGTLHGDISLGNILICPGSVGGKIEGRLIDFDNAERADIVIKPWLYKVQHITTTVSATSTSPSSFFHDFVGESFGTKVSTEVAHVLAISHTIFMIYAQDLLDYKPELRNKEMICARDIGLLDGMKKLPAFTQCVDVNRQRNVTLPFASSEILLGQSIFTIRKPVHNAVHDLEALFWVFTFICLTRDGPGGKRRKELEHGTESTPESQRLIDIYYSLFASSRTRDIAHNKMILFFKDNYRNNVVQHFSLYFKPLELLLLKWWKILRLAHQYPVFEAVHDEFLDALESAMCDLENDPPPIHPESAKIDGSRRLDLESMQYFPWTSIQDYRAHEATRDSLLVSAPGKKREYHGDDHTVTSTSSSPLHQKGTKRQRI